MSGWDWLDKNGEGAFWAILTVAFLAFVAVKHWTPEAAPCVCPPAEVTK